MRWVGEVFDGLGVTGQDRELAFPDGAAFRIEAVPGRDPAGLAVQGDHARAVLHHAAGALHRGDAGAGQ
jgi:hypothetical protein